MEPTATNQRRRTRRATRFALHREEAARGAPACQEPPCRPPPGIVCTIAPSITAPSITARNRQIAQHRQWMVRCYAVTFTFVSSRLLNLWPRYRSHPGDLD
jgi:hypothetical protein